ncbi:MAG: tRNA pseudouridine(55) synthase TruB [Candidatus Zixiibacteriota bacterium]
MSEDRANLNETPRHVYNGALAIDKPVGLTSHDVVQRLRGLLDQKKIGHTGSLDPLATGLLVICLGSASKIARFITGQTKAYEAEIRLGKSTDTYDAEGLIDPLESDTIPGVSLEDIQGELTHFEGEIGQRAPRFAAIKVDGQALYKSARAGIRRRPPIRSVVIHKIALIGYQAPFLRLTIECGKGTYIRSLAHDLGERLGCGGYLSSLRRTRVGSFSLSDALTLEEMEKLSSEDILTEALVPMEQAIGLPSLVVSDSFVPRVRNGVAPGERDIEHIHGEFAAGDCVSLIDKSGRMLAFGISEIPSTALETWSGPGFYRYQRVI